MTSSEGYSPGLSVYRAGAWTVGSTVTVVTVWESRGSSVIPRDDCSSVSGDERADAQPQTT